MNAQTNFEKFGASHEEHQGKVRPAGSGDSRDASWRMINPYLDNLEEFIPWVGREAQYPEGEMTALYYWRETYWRKKTLERFSAVPPMTHLKKQAIRPRGAPLAWKHLRCAKS